jgi:hypothetical protein
MIPAVASAMILQARVASCGASFRSHHGRRFHPCGSAPLDSAHRLPAINPGTPVFTTELNLTLVVMRSRISCMASSGSAEMSKLSRIRRGLVEVVRKAVPRCTAQARAT